MSSSLSFEIRGSAIAGQGAFAIRPIATGERLIEYTGERISHAVADARYDDESMAEHHTFLFAVTDRTVIDATHGGNEARFINHSCDPNCDIEVFPTNYAIRLVANRDIFPGDAVTIDYEMTEEDLVAQGGAFECACGAMNCRGRVIGWKYRAPIAMPPKMRPVTPEPEEAPAPAAAVAVSA